MRLATIYDSGEEIAAIVSDLGLIPVNCLSKLGLNLESTLLRLIESGQVEELNSWWKAEGKDQKEFWSEYLVPNDQVRYAPLYRNPRKIWGIGLNYVEHAEDLHETAPRTEPASFMKPDTTIIGTGDLIEIPRQSKRTTAEAELGVIIGKRCKDINESEAANYIVGYTTILDMTAEDILEVNPRYLTRAKSFDTFFSFGPQLVTTDEIDNLLNLQVATYKNNTIHRINVISNMTFRPFWLLAFHSRVMTLLPGDIISTGTPGAVVISHGDEVECKINGFAPLTNRVRDLKFYK